MGEKPTHGAADDPAEARTVLRLDTSAPTAPFRPTWQPDEGPTEEVELRRAGPDVAPISGPFDPDRYEDLGPLGLGGMGEVRRVRDRHLNRLLAMKILHPDLVEHKAAAMRFIDEAQTTAQLEHPGIVPVHEIGRLADGRVFFTMKEVKGRTLRDVLDQHATDGAGLRSLVSLLHRVCGAVAYAHSRGVIHRDLKPENVMIGAFGEVLVLDWGIAKVRGQAVDEGLDPVVTTRAGTHATRAGAIAGTPRYMAPEQAAGDGARVGPWTDVWALGALLLELVCPLPAEAIPDELEALMAAATAADPADRPRDAAAFAERLASWLDGAQRQEQADALVERARALFPEVEKARAEAAVVRAAGQEALDALPSWSPIETKRPHWRALDRAEEIERQAALRHVEINQLLHAALMHVPDHVAAHGLLADWLQGRHADAEARHDPAEAARYEALLRGHAQPRHQAWLAGHGALTVITDPPGAEVILHRFESVDRMLRPVSQGSIGTTPLVARELPHGSYRLELRASGCTPILVPVEIARQGHWDGVPPGGSESAPLHLPRQGELSEDEVLVPAGWCWVGGDPLAFGPLPARRVWVDAFVIGRFPVTEPEFHAFIEDLLDAGREEEARALVPHNEPQLGGVLWPMVGGRYSLAGRDPRMPAHGVDWFGADGYAKWLARRTGRPYRLPGDVEWEKAARGVDRRFYPFGNHADGAFCSFAGSHQGNPSVQSVDSFPLDVSPYGVRGLGGNVRDWIQCRYERNGHPMVAGRIPVNEDPDPAVSRIQRGGAWSFHEQHARAATRWWQDPLFRHTAAGMRVARPWS